MTDPIVAEVRAARMEHTKRFNHSLSAICADLRLIEKRCGHQLVSLPPKIKVPTRSMQTNARASRR